jgi:hypothetical protein
LKRVGLPDDAAHVVAVAREPHRPVGQRNALQIEPGSDQAGHARRDFEIRQTGDEVRASDFHVREPHAAEGVEILVPGNAGLDAVDRIDSAHRGIGEQQAGRRRRASADPEVPVEEHRAEDAAEVEGVERRLEGQVGSASNLIDAVALRVGIEADDGSAELLGPGDQQVPFRLDEDHLANARQWDEFFRKQCQDGRWRPGRPPEFAVEQCEVEEVLPARLMLNHQPRIRGL